MLYNNGVEALTSGKERIWPDLAADIRWVVTAQADIPWADVAAEDDPGEAASVVSAVPAVVAAAEAALAAEVIAEAVASAGAEAIAAAGVQDSGHCCS